MTSPTSRFAAKTHSMSVIENGKEQVEITTQVRQSPRPLVFFNATPNTSVPLCSTRVRCYLCLATGHTQRTCPLRYCKMCMMYGHNAKQCNSTRNRPWPRTTLTAATATVPCVDPSLAPTTQTIARYRSPARPPPRLPPSPSFRGGASGAFRRK